MKTIQHFVIYWHTKTYNSITVLLNNQSRTTALNVSLKTLPVMCINQLRSAIFLTNTIKTKKPYRQECAIFCLKVWGVLSRLCSCPCKSSWLYIGLSTQYLWVCSRHASCSWACSIVDFTEEEPRKNSSTVSTGKHGCKQNKFGYFFNRRFGISFQIMYFDKLVTRTVKAV